MPKRRLTAKRMTDRRFRRTEKLILEVFSKESKGTNSKNDNISLRTTNPSVKKMMKKIGRSRATFYLHHGGILEVVGDFEEYILGEYRREAKRFEKGSAEEIVYRSLVFVIKNQEIFRMLVGKGEGRIFEMVTEEMLSYFKNPSFQGVDFGTLPETTLAILKGEAIAIFREWGKAGFPEEKIKKVAKDTTWLIKTATRRLEKIR